MPRLFYALLLLIPISLFGGRFGLPGWALFFVSVGAVVPLAGLISVATEQAALVKGPKIGGILNATFGNVPDLLVGYFGVRAGLTGFVKATLVGGVISNTALIIGMSFVAAGLRFRYPRFDAREAGHHAVLMLLATSGMLLPSIVSATVHPVPPLQGLSIGVSAILLLVYLAYVLFSIVGLGGRKAELPGELPIKRAGADQTEVTTDAEAPWPIWRSALLLIVATAFLAPVTDALTSAVTPAIQTLGWTDRFAGIVIVANAGNAAEMYTAVVVAARNRLDLALEVASGSSIQIATFVTPLVVLISLAFHPMDLVFTDLELAILGLVVAIFSYIVHDGEASWLEGSQLMAIYAMAAAVFFILPAA